MMKTEQSHLAKEIEQWEKEFRRKNGRDPTEEDKYVISMVIYRYAQKHKTHFCTFVHVCAHTYINTLNISGIWCFLRRQSVLPVS